MFWIKFIGLTLAYLSVGAIIAALIAKARGKDPWVYLGNGGIWFWVLAGTTVVSFVVACSNDRGPALLLPYFPTPEQKKVVRDILSNLWSGTDASPIVPTEATGTWFWWNAFGIYLLITLFYGFIAFWNVTVNAFKTQMRKAEGKEPNQPANPTYGLIGSFGAALVVAFIAMFIAKIVTHLFIKRGAK